MSLSTTARQSGVTRMRLIDHLRASVRQLRFPRTFRIPRPVPEVRLLEEAEFLFRDLQSTANREMAETPNGPLPEQLIVRVATGLWRLRQRMIDPATGQPREDIRRTYRHVESLWDTLGEFGVEIHDHGGEPFDSGMALVVLSYERDSAVVREMVKETVKPTVYLHKRCVQRGEVIVGSPEL